MDEISPIFPDVRADIEEERRLFYVAMTRARNNLTLLSYDNAVQPFIDYIEKKGSFSNGSGKGTRSGKQSEKQFGEQIGERSAKRTGMHITSRPEAETAAEKAKYKEGAIVCHKTLGSGKIIQVSGDVATVTFDRTGETKKYGIKICVERGIFEFK